MRSNKYEPRVCEICGRLYKPSRRDQRTCASIECTIERKRIYALKNTGEGVYKARKREYTKRQRTAESRKTKADTIIAVGYAERQIAESLKLAGKIDTNL